LPNHKILKPDYLILIFIMVLAFYLTLIPHLGYPYPLHVDEWVHLAKCNAVLEAGSTTLVDPFLGQSALGISSNLEAGFHLFWGIFHQISGISWLTIFRYFPGIIFLITVLSVYILARREGFGWEAALFTCLIPTTIGILGPAFMVPVALGLLFIPLSLFIAFNFRTGWSYPVLFLFTCLLLTIHAPTAVGLVLILTPYILLNLKGNFKHSLGITLALAVPFLAPFPWIFGMLLPTAESLLAPQPLSTFVDLPSILQTYGYLPVLFCLLGTSILAIRGGKKNYGLIFGLLALLAMLVTFFTFHYGVEIMYHRGLMYAILMMSIIAGAGLMGIRSLRLPSNGLKTAFLRKNVGNILCLVLIGLTLALCIPNRQDTAYYHMIDSEDYQAFVWIRDNVDERYDKAVLDPWKATAFTAITGKNIYTKIHSYPKGTDMEAYEFLRGGCTDTAFLRENGIAIVYSQWECQNPDLVEVAKDIYLFRGD